jgi:hypothetical protein
MAALWNEYVVQNFQKYFPQGNTPAKPMVLPVQTLLEMCQFGDDYKHFDTTIAWMLKADLDLIPDFLDSVYTKLCWSPNTLCAEICLRCAKRLKTKQGNREQIQELIHKGLSMAKTSLRKMKDEEGEIILPIAYAMYEPVVDELQELSAEYGVDDVFKQQLDSSDTERTRGSSSILGPANLPSSYTRNISNSEDTGGSISRRSSDSDVIRPSRVVNYSSARSTSESSDGQRYGSRSSLSQIEDLNFGSNASNHSLGGDNAHEGSRRVSFAEIADDLSRKDNVDVKQEPGNVVRESNCP